MPNYAKKQRANRFILLCSILLLNACADKTPPFSIIEQEPEAADITAMKVNITEPKSPEVILYEPEHPVAYIVQKETPCGIFPRTFYVILGIGLKFGSKTLRLKIHI